MIPDKDICLAEPDDTSVHLAYLVVPSINVNKNLAVFGETTSIDTSYSCFDEFTVA